MDPDTFDFFSIFTLGEQFTQLENSIQSLLMNEASLEEFHEELTRFMEFLEAIQWEKSQIWLRQKWKSLYNSNYSKLHVSEKEFQRQCSYLAENLRYQIRQEIFSKPLALLPGLPRQIRREILNSVNDMFPSGVFSQLPSLAQRDFQEAANCYSHGQFTAAAILAWRATEDALSNYFELITGRSTTERDTWGTYSNNLQNFKPSIDAKILKDIDRQREERNSLMHPDKVVDEDIGLIHLREAIHLTAMLVHDLQARDSELRIGLCPLDAEYVTYPQYVDIALSFYILHNNKRSVGTQERIWDKEFRTDGFDYILGAGDGKYSVLKSEKEQRAISSIIASEIGVYRDYKDLIGYVSQYRFGRIQVSHSKSLESVLQAIREQAETEEECWNNLYILFDEIKSQGLKPDSDVIAQNLKQSALIWYKDKTRKDGIELAWSTLVQTQYCGVPVALFECEIGMFEMLERKAFSQDYEIVGFVDLTKSKSLQISLRPRTEKDIDLEPLWRYLQDNHKCHLNYYVRQIASKPTDNWIVKAAELKKQIEEADPYETNVLGDDIALELEDKMLGKDES